MMAKCASPYFAATTRILEQRGSMGILLRRMPKSVIWVGSEFLKVKDSKADVRSGFLFKVKAKFYSCSFYFSLKAPKVVSFFKELSKLCLGGSVT